VKPVVQCSVLLSCRDLEKLELPVYSVKAHREIINAIDGVGGVGIGEGAPEIVTAGRDGECVITVAVWPSGVVVRAVDLHLSGCMFPWYGVDYYGGCMCQHCQVRDP